MMSKITLDSTISNKLRGFKEPVELLDSCGSPLGTFTPADKQSTSSEIRIPFTVEELRRFENEPGGRSLGEILADLEKPR
jgi:hypothetical protein